MLTQAEYERHLKRVTITPSGCWEWQGAKNTPADPIRGGYAVAQVGGRSELLHRGMYEFLVGPIPQGMQLDHLCRVRHCVNPEHLEPVDPRTNIMRGVGPAARNVAKTHCPQGQPV